MIPTKVPRSWLGCWKSCPPRTRCLVPGSPPAVCLLKPQTFPTTVTVADIACLRCGHLAHCVPRTTGCDAAPLSHTRLPASVACQPLVLCLVGRLCGPDARLMSNVVWVLAPFIRAALRVVPAGVGHTPTWAAAVPDGGAWTRVYAADLDVRPRTTPGGTAARTTRYLGRWRGCCRLAMAANKAVPPTAVHQHVFDAKYSTVYARRPSMPCAAACTVCASRASRTTLAPAPWFLPVQYSLAPAADGACAERCVTSSVNV